MKVKGLTKKTSSLHARYITIVSNLSPCKGGFFSQAEVGHEPETSRFEAQLRYRSSKEPGACSVKQGSICNASEMKAGSHLEIQSVSLLRHLRHFSC
ncbi:UNVERIFIED_CONTAM: hypothetical protein FKN15_019081 [Acipenser sinensis]